MNRCRLFWGERRFSIRIFLGILFIGSVVAAAALEHQRRPWLAAGVLAVGLRLNPVWATDHYVDVRKVSDVVAADLVSELSGQSLSNIVKQSGMGPRDFTKIVSTTISAVLLSNLEASGGETSNGAQLEAMKIFIPAVLGLPGDVFSHFKTTSILNLVTPGRCDLAAQRAACSVIVNATADTPSSSSGELVLLWERQTNWFWGWRLVGIYGFGTILKSKSSADFK